MLFLQFKTSYVMFLMLFSYLVLFELDGFARNENFYKDNSTSFKFIGPQYLLYIWLIAIWFEEINQVNIFLITYLNLNFF